MAIYDCFTYYNEDAILRLRFNELYETVTRFVVVEATQTFTGQPKPLYLDALDWVSEFEDKIERVVVDFPKKDMTPWEREAFQRNAIMGGLGACGGADVICISDADEIPRPDRMTCSNPVQLDVTQYFWNIHWQVPAHCNQGARPVVTRYRELLSSTPQQMRAEAMPRVPYGGWHFSFYGDAKMARNKIEAFSHQEMNTQEFKDLEEIFIKSELGIDPFDRFPLKWSDIDATYPKWIQKYGAPK